MKRPSIWFIISLVLFIGSVFLLSNQNARQSLADKLLSSDRKILSVVSGDLLKTGHIFRVIKVLSSSGVTVEVYSPTEDGGQSLWDKVDLPDRKDGYFHLFGQATNLALRDLDSDGKPEILAPTYDAQTKPHLNAIKLNLETKKLEPYTGDMP
jgi:hypothetical protein